MSNRPQGCSGPALSSLLRGLPRGLLLACLAPILFCEACLPAHAQGDPVAGAKAAVRHLSRAKTAAQVASCLTNESAATMGALMAMPLMMQYGFARPGGSARQKTQQAQFQGLLRRYGVEKAEGKGPQSPEWRRFAAHGRSFLVALDQFESRSGTPGHLQQAGGGIPAPEALRYTVLSPTRVAIVNPRHHQGPPMQARLEDGQWRLQISPAGAPGAGAAVSRRR